MAVTLLISKGFSKKILLSYFPVNLQHNNIIKHPTQLICTSTLPCETLVSENERQSQTNVPINDKLVITRYSIYIFKVSEISIIKLRVVNY